MSSPAAETAPAFKPGDLVRWRGRGSRNAGLLTVVLEIHPSGRYLKIMRRGRNGHGNRTICDKWAAIESVYRDPRLERKGGDGGQ